MWRPPERIKYAPTNGPWPTQADAARSRLFSPVSLGALTLDSRTWVPAMVPWRATEEGEVTAEVLDWYKRFAQGQPGAIVVEATGIRDVASGPLLRIGADRFVPGLQRLVQTVREASAGHTRLFVQLIDFLSIRRRPPAEKYFERFLHIDQRHRRAFVQHGEQALDDSAVRRWLAALPREHLERVLSAPELESLDFGYRERVTDLHLAHVRDLPRQLPSLFADAARRARLAGFDGIELHYAHAYTMASFLSPLNTREDGYGGDRESRLKLPLEVFAAVQAEVGGDFTIGCRFLADECIEGGGSVEDAGFFAAGFARAGMDFISVSRGGKFDDAKQPKVGEAAYPYTGRSGYECMPSYVSDAQGPFGRNLPAVKRIRDAVRRAGFATPIVAAGGVHHFEQAEHILASGEGDIVALARQALADPDWFRKVRMGRGNEVRLCLFTNYCEALDQRHKQVTCELWDRADLGEPGVALSNDGKRRLTAPEWKAT